MNSRHRQIGNGRARAAARALALGHERFAPPRFEASIIGLITALQRAPMLAYGRSRSGRPPRYAASAGRAKSPFKPVVLLQSSKRQRSRF